MIENHSLYLKTEGVLALKGEARCTNVFQGVPTSEEAQTRSARLLPPGRQSERSNHLGSSQLIYYEFPVFVDLRNIRANIFHT